MDLIIRNGKIVDGTGNPAYNADIGIAYGKIVKVKKALLVKAEIEIDASNHIVCPGFIDIHSHTDLILPLFSKIAASARCSSVYDNPRQ